jgi:hypothetical protein
MDSQKNLFGEQQQRRAVIALVVSGMVLVVMGILKALK